MGKGLAILGLLLLVGCVRNPVLNEFCAVVEGPWRPTKAEIAKLSDETRVRMLEQNLYGKKYCGWKKK